MSKCKCCGEEIGSVDVCPICGAAHVVEPPQPTFSQPMFSQPTFSQPTSAPQNPPPLTERTRPRIQNDLYADRVRAEANYNVEDSCGDVSWRTVFTSENGWKSAWKKFLKDGDQVGIILTDTTNLTARSIFDKTLDEYVEYKEKEGVSYCLLDLATQKVGDDFEDCLDIIGLLLDVYEVAVPDYLLIVGDTSVIPSEEWDNESGDGDETVLSDLPYVTLDDDSPWEGYDYDFDGVTQVGRIPTSAKNSFMEAVKYFRGVIGTNPYSKVKTFAYTAKVWTTTSKEEFAHLSPFMISSPEYTSNKMLAQSNGYKLIGGIDDSCNLLCFNLHGSDATHLWYGQREMGAPCIEALDGDVITYQRKSPYFICTEACYGARPIIGGPRESIVVHALSNKCLAFVGSSRIAYGYADGGMCCADIIANVFTSYVAKGATCGEAFLKALEKLSSKRMDEEEIKTLAEFALYGDPSVTLVAGAKSKAVKRVTLSVPKAKKSGSLGFSLMSCDNFGYVGRANKSATAGLSEMEKIQIRKMASNIRAVGKNALKSANVEMSDVDPKVFKVVGAGGYRAVYSKVENDIKTVVKLHMDDNGNVEKMYTSK